MFSHKMMAGQPTPTKIRTRQLGSRYLHSIPTLWPASTIQQQKESSGVTKKQLIRTTFQVVPGLVPDFYIPFLGNVNGQMILKETQTVQKVQTICFFQIFMFLPFMLLDIFFALDLHGKKENSPEKHSSCFADPVGFCGIREKGLREQLRPAQSVACPKDSDDWNQTTRDGFKRNKVLF